MEKEISSFVTFLEGNQQMNAICMIVVTVFIFIVIIMNLMKIARAYTESKIELLLLGEDEEIRRKTADFLMPIGVYTVCNFVLAIQSITIVIAIFCFMFAAILWFITFIIKKLYSRKSVKNEKKKEICEYLYFRAKIALIVLSFPIFISALNYSGGKLFISCIIASLVQCFMLKPESSNTLLEKSKMLIVKKDSLEYWYIYRAIKYNLLCGDSEVMKEANQIISIPIKKFYAEEYYITLQSDKVKKEIDNKLNVKL